VKHCGILTKPCSRNWAFWASVRVKSGFSIELDILFLFAEFVVLKLEKLDGVRMEEMMWF